MFDEVFTSLVLCEEKPSVGFFTLPSPSLQITERNYLKLLKEMEKRNFTSFISFLPDPSAFYSVK